MWDPVPATPVCRGEYGVLAHDAVRLLTDRGHRAVRLHDGMLEWRLSETPRPAEPRAVGPRTGVPKQKKLG